MKTLLSHFKYRILLCLMIVLGTHCNQSPLENEVPTLSLIQQLELKFINQELQRQRKLFINDWNSKQAQFIIETAELAVQTSPRKTQPMMQENIIDLFAQIAIAIEFTDQNLIIKIDSTVKKSLFDSTNINHPYHRFKKHRHHSAHTHAHGAHAPHRIHGGRRTMKRLKKKREERARRLKELAKMHHEAAAKEAVHQQAQKPEITIGSLEFWHNRQEQMHMQQRSKVAKQQGSEDEVLPFMHD